MILKKASSRGQCRLERYSDEEQFNNSTNESHKHIILTDAQSVSRVCSKIKKYAIAINFKDDKVKQFAFDSGE